MLCLQAHLARRAPGTSQAGVCHCIRLDALDRQVRSVNKDASAWKLSVLRTQAEECCGAQEGGETQLNELAAFWPIQRLEVVSSDSDE